MEPRIADLGAALLERVEALGNDLAAIVRSRVDYYAESDAVALAELSASCVDNLRYVFEALAGSTPLDLAAAEATGARRGEAGVPLPDVMAAYRVGFRHVWELVVAEGRESGFSTDTLMEATAHAVLAHDTFAQAASEAYRAVVEEQLLRDEARRNALVDALIAGRVTDRGTLWEIADVLGLPTRGPYVAVVVTLTELGRPALVGLSERLMGGDLPAAWLLRQDQQIGIVAVRKPGQAQALAELLESVATTRIGVSPAYDELAGTRDAVRLARIATTGGHNGSLVTIFDDAPLAIAAMGAPEVMQRVARRVFGGLDGLRPEERAVLVDTFAAWVEGGGSTAKAAESLYLHPNTVRQRLNRLERSTGKALADPRDVAELCLALEVYRRMPVEDAVD